MGTLVHFKSGKTVEISPRETPAFWGRLRNAGIRYFDSREQNLVIPFNSETIEFIEPEKDKPKTAGEIEAEKKDREEQVNTATEDKNDVEERRKALQKDFMERANCQHKDEDGTTRRKLFFSETVNGRKYFPVCTFCGHRERYVGVQKIEEGNDPIWTIEDVKAAKPYEV